MTAAEVDADVRRLSAEFHAAKAKDPDLIPYIGPEDTLQRFLDGAIITHQDFVCDLSPFTVKAVLPEQMRRLKFMLDRSGAWVGEATVTEVPDDYSARRNFVPDDPTTAADFDPSKWTGTVLSGLIGSRTECGLCGREWHDGACGLGG